MGNTRLALTVKVNHGNQHTAKQVMPSLWRYYDGLPDQQKPTLIRGDIFLCNEGFLVEAEKRKADCLTKLRLTANVKRFITKLFHEADWADAGQGFEGAESSLKLTGWSKARRVVVLDGQRVKPSRQSSVPYYPFALAYRAPKTLTLIKREPPLLTKTEPPVPILFV